MGKAIKWACWQLDAMRRYYADTKTEEIADLLGISTHSVRRKAKQMGLRKSKAFMVKWARIGSTISMVLPNAGRFRKGNKPKVGFKKGNTATAKPVIDTSTKVVYISAAAAARALGVCRSTISQSCLKGYKAAGHYFTYVK